jgi:hypothetical protein
MVAAIDCVLKLTRFKGKQKFFCNRIINVDYETEVALAVKRA